MKTRVVLSLVVVLGVALLTTSAGQAAPVISRQHFEFPVAINDCGVSTLELSIDAFNLVQFTTLPNGTVLGTNTTVDRGTGLDQSSGVTYTFVDRFTQGILLGPDQRFVSTAERTLVISSSSGGLLARADTHTTVLPNGEAVSDFNVQFVRCR
jgi:hypothetical protein